MKLRRSGRLIDMTHFLLEHPHQLVPLTFFSERYESAKSSISEDLAIIKEQFEQQGIGTIATVSGAAGGVKFISKIGKQEAIQVENDLKKLLAVPERILPGGYLYMTDVLGHPKYVNQIGRIFASIFSDHNIDVVMTIATKGIPLAYAVASHVNVPVVVVRNDNRVTEGSTVSINYVSGSSKRIQTMTLARRSLKPGANVLIIDDFMRAGGTINGMIHLLEEFQAKLAGIGVFVESAAIKERLVEEYVSVLKLSHVSEKDKKIEIVSGNYLQHEHKFL